MSNERLAPSSVPGGAAEHPTQIPARGWTQVLRRAWGEVKTHNVALLSGGVAFFAFLALFPALIAGISLVALVADPATITAQVRSFTNGLPPAASQLIADQLASVTRSSGGSLSLTLIVSLGLALFSASSGTSHMMQAINIAYGEQESRGYLKLRSLALGLTVAAVVFFVLTLALVAVVPAVLDALPIGVVGAVLAQAARWVLLAVLVVAALAVLYRVAADREAPRLRWVTLGSVIATILWLLGSIGFSLYVNFFGHYNKTYGAIAGVIVLMLWLYLTCFIVLLGAEINAESERQTARDTTTGEPAPMGERQAVAADTTAGHP
ncbi:YihY/virulence factor BrkB family protein [Pseudonocardia sp.]|uniref:YihY/virulence factor BrkB family protein n=1 Tax=Pseudonocardia sp. TaxID=60912 RepID=UPI0025F1CD51|nr:YihY/virulence factor BrkB family protein [Pseudonocardia sp.]